MRQTPVSYTDDAGDSTRPSSVVWTCTENQTHARSMSHREQTQNVTQNEGARYMAVVTMA